LMSVIMFFFFQAEDGIRDGHVTGVQTCALPIYLMSQGENSSEVRNYIREKIRAGKFLIKSLHQRQQTILNIAKEIVQRQREFLEIGERRVGKECRYRWSRDLCKKKRRNNRKTIE